MDNDNRQQASNRDLLLVFSLIPNPFSLFPNS